MAKQQETEAERKKREANEAEATRVAEEKAKKEREENEELARMQVLENEKKADDAQRAKWPVSYEIIGAVITQDKLIGAVKGRNKLTDEQWGGMRASAQEDLINLELNFARNQVPPPSQASVVLSGETVQVNVPKPFKLRLDNNHVLDVSAGVQHVSRTIAEHPYARANGVRHHAPAPVKKED